MIVTIDCACGEQTTCTMHRHMGATDLIPDQCPECDEPWPFDVLETAEVEE